MVALIVLSRLRGVAPRRGAPLLRRSDLETLAWIGEQYAARTDQLERLLGCGERTVQRMLVRLREMELVRVQRVLVGEAAWVLPTARGLRACGSPFGAWQPKLGMLAHTAAVNEVRLQIQARSPGSRWVCERALAKQRASGQHRPDAVVDTDGLQAAIEVELTVKSRRRVTAILDELVGRYGAVVYYCAPATYRLLSELAATGRWPALVVRELPHP